MSEIVKNEFTLKNVFSLFGFAVMGVGLTLSALDPNAVSKRLKREYRCTFSDLFKNSNERSEVQSALEELPDGYEDALAEWMNKALEHNSGNIYKGKVKPHHVMLDILRSALSLTQRD